MLGWHRVLFEIIARYLINLKVTRKVGTQSSSECIDNIQIGNCLIRSKTILKKRLFFPYEQKVSGISESTPNLSQSKGASHVSSIVRELELVTKDVGSITDFQGEPQPRAIPMQFTHITRERDYAYYRSGNTSNV